LHPNERKIPSGSNIQTEDPQLDLNGGMNGNRRTMPVRGGSYNKVPEEQKFLKKVIS
jgi:hypothetical protein